jgi:hypothetical protein
MTEIFTPDNQIKLYTTSLGKTPDLQADALLKIGGESTTLFVPNINASKWGDECFLNINHPDQVKISDVQDFKDGTIRLDCGNNSHRYFIKEDGSLEYEIWFASQPEKPEVILNLLNTQGLEFLYQPALTDEELKFGAIRPENVIGSYAVYWNKRDNNIRPGNSAIFTALSSPTQKEINPGPNSLSILLPELCRSGWMRLGLQMPPILSFLTPISDIKLLGHPTTTNWTRGIQPPFNFTPFLPQGQIPSIIFRFIAIPWLPGLPNMVFTVNQEECPQVGWSMIIRLSMWQQQPDGLRTQMILIMLSPPQLNIGRQQGA